MRFISIAFLFLWVINAELLTAQNKDSAEGDWEALMELYNDLGGDNWKNNSGWDSGSVVTNDWYGVEVDENNRVITLDLAGGPMKGEGVIGGNNLSGNRLTPKLGNLKKVEYINLKQNKIIDATLPAEWENMTNLKELYIAGAIDMVSSKFGLNSIKDSKVNTATNIIIGELPSEWGNMPSIERIEIGFTSSKKDVNGNFFGGLSGSLPPEWGNATTLRSILLYNNLELEGVLPPAWGALTELNHLDLNGTQSQGSKISSELPPEWGGANGFPGMRKMTQLRFGGINVIGGIPDSWANMKMLWQIVMSSTGIGGDFPQFWGNGDFHNRVTTDNPDPDAIPVEAYHSGLGIIAADFSNFTGSFPDFSQMTWLNVFRVPMSDISGKFPEDAAGLSRLIQYDITSNGTSGSLPDLSTWSRIRFVNVPNNRLSGSLPDLDTTNSSFRNSQWQNNNFSGSIPESWNFPGSSGIFRLWLHNNELSGPIPERLADTGHSYSSGFRVDGNRYVFKDLVPFIELGPNNFIYAPQKPFGTERTVTQAAGQRVELEFPEVSHTDNRYQWMKNGSDISGATSRTLTISSMSDSDQGTYSLRVTNPNAPDLTLTSVDIELVVGDGSNTNDLQPPDTPSLLSPETGATGISRSPTLSWSQATDAASYRVQVSPVQTFDTSFIDSSGIGGTGVQISGLEFETEYFWRVQAVNEAGTGDWSQSRSFTTLDEPLEAPGVPVLISPTAGETEVSRSPLLDWDVAANAASYRMQLSVSQTFETVENDITGIFDTEISVSGLDYETVYYWRVQAINEAGTSDWSQTRLFTTLDEPLSAPSSPGLLLPEAGSTDISRTPELSWSAPADAETYRVQVSESSGFGSLAVDLNNISEPHALADNLNYGTTYFWRVQAANDAGQSNWSEIRSFSTRDQPQLPPSAPLLVSPQSGSEDISSRNHTFSWNEADGAETYRLQLSVNNNPFTPSIDIENINDISRSVEGLEPETTYLWRVQALNGAGSSEWSEIWFFVTDEAAPTPSLPLANSTKVELNPTFSWNRLDADEYILQVNRASSGETVIEETVSDTTFTTDSELDQLTVYRWRVKAVTDSTEGDWGPSVAFTTGTGDSGGDSGTGDDDSDDGDGNNDENEDNTDNNSEESITTIEQNYPNPFNPSTVIEFRLAEAQQVSLKIYNLAGQRVATLVNEALSAGTHSKVFDAAGLASGIYFYRLITERNIFTKKMTLIK